MGRKLESYEDDYGNTVKDDDTVILNGKEYRVAYISDYYVNLDGGRGRWMHHPLSCGKPYIKGVNTIQIEAGKYYKTRDGRKVGPMRIDYDGDFDVDHECDDLNMQVWNPDGSVWGDKGDEGNQYLIAEWQDETVSPDFAALAAQHRIKITVQVGEVLIEYDGRE